MSATKPDEERAGEIVREHRLKHGLGPKPDTLVSAIAAALSAVRMEERAATVAWLRADAVLPRQLIAQLERGEHIASRSSRRKSLT